MPTNDELRLITRVTKMYYELGSSQAEIATRLSLSQSTVSRLIRRAREEGIIRFNIHIPAGVNVDLEEKLIARYSLKDAVVVDSIAQDEAQLMHDLGSAAAYYIDATLRDNEVVGISSWSSSLLALVDAMRPLSGKKCAQVVQILGGVGNPAAEVHATRLTGRFAALVNGTPFYLPAPGIVGSEGALRVLLEDPYVKEAVDLFDRVTLALVGIGTVEPSKLLNLSGNVFSQVEQDALRRG
jgi:DNA-binding transcriptional regulator LsrR (DeoR family)